MGFFGLASFSDTATFSYQNDNQLLTFKGNWNTIDSPNMDLLYLHINDWDSSSIAWITIPSIGWTDVFRYTFQSDTLIMIDESEDCWEDIWLPIQPS